MTKTCKNYTWKVLQLTVSPKQSKTCFIIKRCCKNPILADNVIFFLYFASWQRVAEVDVLWQKRQTIQDDSRRDNETCWLLVVRSLTNPPDLVISSPKTKGSVIPHDKWSLSSEDLANVSQGRTKGNIQSTPVEWAVSKGGASPAMQGLTDHLLGLLTRASACPICPINRCTFVWHTFSP